MDSDVTPMFRDERKREKVKMPSLSEMKDPMERASNAQSGTQMMFATLKQEVGEELGKPGTDQLASRWSTMLQTGGVTTQVYAVDPGKILFVVSQPGVVRRLKEFVLSQPETDWFEKDQKQFFPEGRSVPLMDNEKRKQRDIELGLRKPDPPSVAPKAKARRKRKNQKRKA